MFASTFSVPLALTLVVVEDLPSTLLPFLLVISFSNADISDIFGLSKADDTMSSGISHTTYHE